MAYISDKLTALRTAADEVEQLLDWDSALSQPEVKTLLAVIDTIV